MFSPIPLAATWVRQAQGGGYGGPPPGAGYGGPPPGAGYGSGGGSAPGGYGPPGAGGSGPPPGKPITGSAATMAMHALTIDPKTGLPRGEKPPASTAAVVALVCGILLCLGPFTGIPAIIAGLLGRKAARELPHAVGGSGMASAGLLLGVINVVVSLIATALLVWSALS